MKVVVPMAGRGSRFASTAGTVPKPLIPVMGRPMVSWALRSIENVLFNQIIFIALKEHVEVSGKEGPQLRNGASV